MGRDLSIQDHGFMESFPVSLYPIFPVTPQVGPVWIIYHTFRESHKPILRLQLLLLRLGGILVCDCSNTIQPRNLKRGRKSYISILFHFYYIPIQYDIGHFYSPEYNLDLIFDSLSYIVFHRLSL